MPTSIYFAKTKS